MGCTLRKLRMVARLPTSSDFLYRCQLAQAHQFCFGGLYNETTAPSPADHPVDIFNQLLRQDYVSASRRHVFPLKIRVCLYLAHFKAHKMTPKHRLSPLKVAAGVGAIFALVLLMYSDQVLADNSDQDAAQALTTWRRRDSVPSPTPS